MNALTTPQLRKVIAVMRSLTRPEIEANGWRIRDADWLRFQDNPYQLFLRATPAQRAGITDIVNRKVSSHA